MTGRRFGAQGWHWWFWSLVPGLILSLAFGIFARIPGHAWFWLLASWALWGATVQGITLLLPRAWGGACWALGQALFFHAFFLATFSSSISFRYWGLPLDRTMLYLCPPYAKKYCDAIGLSEPSFFAILFLSWLPYAALVWALSAVPKARPRLPRWALALFCLQAFLIWDSSRDEQARWLPHQLWRWAPSHATIYANGITPFYPSPDRKEALERSAAARKALVPAQPKRKHVIVFILDALRPDRLGAYGSKRALSPFMDSLGQKGHAVVVEEAYAQAPESLLGIASIMAPYWPKRMAPGVLSFPEVLKAHGFRSHFFVVGPHDWWRLRDFYGEPDDFYSPAISADITRGDYPTLERIEQIPAADGEKHLIVIHLMVAHDTGVASPGFMRHKPSISWHKAFQLHQVKEGDPATAPGLINDYDNRVSELDAELARAWKALGAKGYLKDSVAVFMADHGESLGEQGIWGHCVILSQKILRIPMIFWSDRRLSVDGGRMAAAIDAAPTLLDELGLGIPELWDGRPLTRSSKERRWVVSEDLFRDPAWAVLLWRSPAGPLKYWRQKRPGADADSAVELLYQLDKDPQEEHTVWPSAPEPFRRAFQRQRDLLLSP